MSRLTTMLVVGLLGFATLGGLRGAGTASPIEPVARAVPPHLEAVDRTGSHEQRDTRNADGLMRATLATVERNIVGWWSGRGPPGECADCNDRVESGPFALPLSPPVWLLLAGLVGMACVARRSWPDSKDNAD